MMGWHVSVYRKAAERMKPATAESERGPRLAVWQGGLGSLSWIRALTATADGEDLGGGGYPVRFTARAAVLDAPVRNGPPEAKEVWSSDVGDVIDFAIWPGRTVVDEVGLAECDPNEWLLIEAWDES